MISCWAVLTASSGPLIDIRRVSALSLLSDILIIAPEICLRTTHTLFRFVWICNVCQITAAAAATTTTTTNTTTTGVKAYQKKPGTSLLWLVHTADTDETKLSCLVRVGGVNKPLRRYSTSACPFGRQPVRGCTDTWHPLPWLGSIDTDVQKLHIII